LAVIRPFKAIHYAKRDDLDLAKVLAPPYDVLDEQHRDELQNRDPHNIVRIDLPHLPPKTAGPDHVYQHSAATLQQWLDEGVLTQDPRAAMYPYMQSYQHGGRTFHRRGFVALVRLAPFDKGEVVPHERTYKGPIEDRLKLMHATGVQLSPIFGLFSDPRNEITNLLYHNASRPLASGTLDGVQNDLWRIADADLENHLIDLFRKKPVYIADGHHRYTTALQYQQEMLQQHGGKLPPNHPANWCMFVLVSMQDPGLVIQPTHRLIGGLETFDLSAVEARIGGHVQIQPSDLGPDRIDDFAHSLAQAPPHTFGLYDGRTRRLYTLRLTDPDVLQPLEPNQSEAWRRLDVAILHRYLLDEVIHPLFAPGREITRGYTADASQIPSLVDGDHYQVALLLEPTPLNALEELGRTGEVMPQKSTYFYPKLATGMLINPLR
jgi:uncharacterized protein (DUF1015 family)